jgi:hypothetical protein
MTLMRVCRYFAGYDKGRTQVMKVGAGAAAGDRYNDDKRLQGQE